MANSVIFDGSGDYISYTPQGQFAGTGAQTHLAIIKVNKSGQLHTVMGYQVTPNFWALVLSAASPTELYFTDGPTDNLSGLTLVIGEWYLVGWCKPSGSSAGRFHRYRYSTSTWSHGAGGSALSDRSTMSSVRIPEDFGGNAGAINVLIAGVWDRELSDNEIEGLALTHQSWYVAQPDEAWRLTQVQALSTFAAGGTANSPSTVSETPTVQKDVAPSGWKDLPPYSNAVMRDRPRGYWRMNESSGMLQDTSGWANHAISVGGTPTYGGATPILTDNTAKSIAFNGTTNFFGIADHTSLDLGDVFTLEAWVKAGSATGAGEQFGIVGKDSGAYYMRIYETGQLEILRAGIADICWATIDTADDQNWHHCVVTKNGSDVKVYMDGVNQTGTITNSTCVDNSAGLTIGAGTSSTEFFEGSIAEVSVYSYDIGANRVLEHYAAALPPPVSPMTFPTTLLVDDFNRADGGLGANWTSPIVVGTSTPTVWSNRMVGVSSADNHSVYNGFTCLQTEVHCTYRSDQWIYLWGRVNSPNTAGMDGVVMRMRAEDDLCEVFIYVDGSIVSADSGSVVTGGVPESGQLGMVVLNAGSNLIVHSFVDGVRVRTTVFDNGVTLYPSVATAGMIGCGLYGGGNDAGRAIDNFGGGPTTWTETFPTTGLLDNFNRPDSASSLGPNWTDQPEGGYTSLGITSNQVTCVGGTFRGNYWSAQRFKANQEIYVDIPVLSAYRLRLYGRWQDTSNNYWINHVSTGQIEIGYRSSNTEVFANAYQCTGNFHLTAGDSLGMEVRDGTITVYVKTSGVWYRLFLFVNHLITNSGYIGMHVGDETTIRIDNFSGGDLVVTDIRHDFSNLPKQK